PAVKTPAVKTPVDKGPAVRAIAVRPAENSGVARAKVPAKPHKITTPALLPGTQPSTTGKASAQSASVPAK
ncbi:MAG: hypothetical protein ACRD19_09710, partial [Terriglobia bacterium]